MRDETPSTTARDSSGRNPRVTRKRRDWQSTIADWRRSGESQVDYCRARGITIGTFRWWKSQLDRGRISTRRRRGAIRTPRAAEAAAPTVGPTLIPVTLCAEPTGAAIEVVLTGGRTVRIADDFHEETLRRIVAVLESVPCSH